MAASRNRSTLPELMVSLRIAASAAVVCFAAQSFSSSTSPLQELIG